MSNAPSRTIAALALLGAALAAHAFERDSAVHRACTPCHAAGADGRIARVEDVRTTPEEWAVIVGRMRTLHGMSLGPGDMDRLLKELASSQLLSPAEQKEVAYLSLWHNAQVVEEPAGKDEEKLFTTCVRCHTWGKIRSYRMTKDAWSKLRDFHLYVVPTVVFQMREMRWVEEADAALAALASKLPYGERWTPPPAKLDGEWRVFGWQPGRGAFRGTIRVTAAERDEFAYAGNLAHADGANDAVEGQATLYGGYALRTRTTTGGVPGWGAYVVAGDEVAGEFHRAAPDFRTSSARWLRAGSGPKVARIVPGYVLSGETITLTVDGVDLPEVSAADVRFEDPAVQVLAAERAGDGTLRLTVRSRATRVGVSRVWLKGLDATSVALAPRIDSIAIVPPLGRARLSGSLHVPAEGVQFEAIAYARSGAGRQAKTIALGPVPATFRLVEAKTRPDDDDLRWLGTIAPNGAYVPAGDYGPNPKRAYNAENSGLVGVIASYRHAGRTYTARAQLAVTMPDYIARIR